MKRLLALVPLALGLPACATLHRAQLDEIDATRGRLEPFEIHVSDSGVDVKAIGAIASAATRSKGPSQLANVLAMFEFGPKTGQPTFSDSFADHVADDILAKCPSGRVTGLLSLRETTSYAAVTGEYVTIRGFCIVD